MSDGPRLILGINNCFAVKRWQEPADWARVIRDDLGLQHVQLSADMLPFGFSVEATLAYAERARRAADEFGLQIHSVFTGLAAYSSPLLAADSPLARQAAFEWYEAMIRVAAAAGARGFGGHLGAVSVTAAADDNLTRSLHEDQFAAMRRLADAASAAGLDHLQFENLAVGREFGHSIEEAHAIEAAMTGTAVAWRLCLDLGHPAALDDPRSANPVNWINETWAHTPVVQLQQSPRGADHHGPFTAATHATGIVNRDAVLEALSNWSGDVYLFFEIMHSHEYDDRAVISELQESVDFWRSAITI